MGRIRRVAQCALAVLGTVAGCTPVPVAPQRYVSRSQQPTRQADAPPATPTFPAPPEALELGCGPLPNGTPPVAPDSSLPINLASAFRLAGGRPLDVQIAGRQVEAAVAAFDRARLLWLPTLVAGTDYFVHAGPQQNFSGDILKSTRSTFMAGIGPQMVFSFSDAVYAPLAARQELRARQLGQQAAINDVALQVAEAYFGVQQARGELAGALLAEKQADNLLRRATGLAKGLAPPPEESRAKVELARRKQAVIAARERWRTASAELARLLRLDPRVVVEPTEPPFLPVTVIDPMVPLDGLIPIALTNRPELAGHQAVVRATLARLEQEKVRPLVPSLVLRGASTNPAGTLGYGAFGGGHSGVLRDFGGRFDVDMQLLWEFEALGFGNKARIGERKAEYAAATLDLFRTQDRVAAEVVRAFAEVRSAAERLNEAEPALREAAELVNTSLAGLGQTRTLGDARVLIIRPQEAVAAVQAFGHANADFFGAVADYNRAQFRLYRALGHPAQCLAAAVPGAPEANEEKPAQPGVLPPVTPETGSAPMRTPPPR